MKWPGGKYNGERIVGCEVRFKLNLSFWVVGAGTRHAPSLHIGPLHWWFSPVYSWR